MLIQIQCIGVHFYIYFFIVTSKYLFKELIKTSFTCGALVGDCGKLGARVSVTGDNGFMLIFPNGLLFKKKRKKVSNKNVKHMPIIRETNEVVGTFSDDFFFPDFC